MKVFLNENYSKILYNTIQYNILIELKQHNEIKVCSK